MLTLREIWGFFIEKFGNYEYLPYLSLVKKMKVIRYRLLRGYCTLWYREKCEVVFIIFKTWRGWRDHRTPDGRIKWFTSIDEANEEVYNLYPGCVYLSQIIER